MMSVITKDGHVINSSPLVDTKINIRISSGYLANLSQA